MCIWLIPFPCPSMCSDTNSQLEDFKKPVWQMEELELESLRKQLEMEEKKSCYVAEVCIVIHANIEDYIFIGFNH